MLTALESVPEPLSMNVTRQQLHSLGLARLAAGIRTARKPAIRLTTGKRSAQAVNRFGGRPNLPKVIRWPDWMDGQPLSFIAQLDLATLPKIRDLPLPRSGSLFFFYDAENQPWGFDPKDKGSAAVIYSPAALAGNPLRAPHGDLDEAVRFKGVAVTAAQEMSLPSLRVLRDLHATSEEFDAYFKLADPLQGPVHRIGGNATEIQGDIFLEAQLVSNGLYCGNNRGYTLGRERGLDRGAADWRLLLQLDSEPTSGMYWGDSGRIFFLIRYDDLRCRRFDTVWVILQCT